MPEPIQLDVAEKHPTTEFKLKWALDAVLAITQNFTRPITFLDDDFIPSPASSLSVAGPTSYYTEKNRNNQNRISINSLTISSLTTSICTFSPFIKDELPKLLAKTNPTRSYLLSSTQGHFSSNSPLFPPSSISLLDSSQQHANTSVRSCYSSAQNSPKSSPHLTQRKSKNPLVKEKTRTPHDLVPLPL